MTWFLRGRRAAWAALVAVGSFALIGPLGSAGIAVPALAGSPTQLVWAMLAPLPVVVTACAGLARERSIELVAARRVATYDALVCVGLVALTVGVALVLVPWAGATGLAAARSLAGLLALALVVARRFGQRFGALTAVVVVLASALAGTDVTGIVRWWAFPIAPTGAAAADVLVALLACAAALARPSTRVRARSLAAAE
jgi:hypothetical protein